MRPSTTVIRLTTKKDIKVSIANKKKVFRSKK